MFTSTPIIQRPDQRSEQSSSQKKKKKKNSECILSIFNMLRDMETELKEIKQNVVSCMERKIDDLKSTLLTVFEKASTEKSYSAVVIENSSSTPINVSRATDERFCNSSTSGNVSDPSHIT